METVIPLIKIAKRRKILLSRSIRLKRETFSRSDIKDYPNSMPFFLLYLFVSSQRKLIRMGRKVIIMKLDGNTMFNNRVLGVRKEQFCYFLGYYKKLGYKWKLLLTCYSSFVSSTHLNFQYPIFIRIPFTETQPYRRELTIRHSPYPLNNEWKTKNEEVNKAHKEEF